MASTEPTIAYDLAAEQAPPCPVCQADGVPTALDSKVMEYVCSKCNTRYYIQRNTGEAQHA
jgi:hypothetical protein